jgi:hypothetical protein
LLAVVGPASAAPIVYEDVSGSAGDWTYTFYVTNTDPTNNLTVFGITSPLPITLEARPTGWTTETFPAAPAPPLLADFCDGGPCPFPPGDSNAIAPGDMGVFTALDTIDTKEEWQRWHFPLGNGSLEGLFAA